MHFNSPCRSFILTLPWKDAHNEKGAESKRQDISIHLTDKYSSLPSFSELLNFEKCWQN